MKYLAIAGILLLAGCKKTETIPATETAKVYVANGGSGTVSVISVPAFKVTKTIDISTETYMLMPHNVQVAPDGKTVWVTAMPHSNSDSDQVVVLDAATDQVVRRIMLAPNSHLAHVVFDGSSHHAYLTATRISAVFEIDAQHYQVIKKHELPAEYGPHGARWCNGKLYIANTTAQRMSILDTRTGAIQEVETDDLLTQTAVIPGKPYIFASQFRTKSIMKYDTLTKAVSTIPLPAGALGPIQLYPTCDGRFLYICDQGNQEGRPASNKVFVLDIAAGTFANPIDVGMAAHGVVVGNDDKYAFVTNSGDHTVSVIETATPKVIATIAVGLAPNGISFRYSGGGMP